MTGSQNRTDLFLPQPAAASGRRLGRYSLFVTGMKVILPSLAAGILVAVFVWSSGNTPSPKSKNVESIDATMREAVYESRDKQNRPYSLTAPVARQNPDKPDILDLASPTGTLDMGGNESISGNARSAVYDQKNGVLDLKGALTLKHTDGTTLTTDGATVDVNNENVKGQNPVLLQGSFGEVRGQGIEVKDGGKIVTFTGQSSARLKLGSGKSGNSSGKTDSFRGIIP